MIDIMSVEAVTRGEGGAVRTPRGRPAKRDAIIESALDLLARDGYAAASMDAIAAAAGVAKPTIYNHFSDKAELFATVLEVYSTRSQAAFLDAVATIDVHSADLRAELQAAARALLACLVSPSGQAVLRLEVTEATRFPQLIGEMRTQGTARTLDAIAGKFAQLVVAGRLSGDPERIGRQFYDLVLGEPLRCSGFGQREVPADVAERAVRDGVDTVLAAFGVDTPASSEIRRGHP